MIPALIGTGTVLFLSILGGFWHLSGRLGKIEGQLNGVVKKERCGEIRLGLLRELQRSRAQHERAHHEVSAVKIPRP